MKCCRVCNSELVIGINQTEGAARNYDWICQTCEGIRKRAHYEKNKTKMVQHHKKYQLENREQILAYKRAWYQRRRTILKRYKQMKGCIVCGENNPTVLQFHAPNGHKEGKVSCLINNWSKLKTEIARCIVVCANCHLQIHAEEIELPNKEI